MAEAVGTPAGGSQRPVTLPGGDVGLGRREQPRHWATAKLVFRLIIIVASVIATIVALVTAKGPRDYGDWVMLSPLYALPYTLLSLIWEVIEIIVLLVRRSRSKGIQPIAHLTCELLLWLSGVPLGTVWTCITWSNQHDSFRVQDGTDPFEKWASLNYLWSALVFLTTICQFVLFVLSCIEVDRKRRNLERQVNHILQIIEERGQKPEDVLASLAPPAYVPGTPVYGDAGGGGGTISRPTWPVEMPAINPEPVEMGVEERPVEMVGSLAGRELPTPVGNTTNGDQEVEARK